MFDDGHVDVRNADDWNDGGDDEELAQPAPRRRAWQVGVAVAVLLVAAGIVVGLSHGNGSAPTPTSSSESTESSADATAQAGPVIPTFGTRTDLPDDDSSYTFDVGRSRTRITLPGGVPLLFVPCIDARRCRLSFTPPGAVVSALHTLVPGCRPAFDELVRRHDGQSTVVLRNVLCAQAPERVLVTVCRARPPGALTGRLDHESVVYVTHVAGPYSVQVVLQGTRDVHPDIGDARTLSADPRLLSGLHASS